LPRFASKARTVNVVLPLIATVEAGWRVTWKFAAGETVTVDRLSTAVPVFATVKVTSLGAVPKSTAVLWPLVNAPPLQLHAMLGPTLVTVTVYVDVVVPSCAVTTVVSMLDPTTSGSAALAAPDATVTPLTFTVAVLSVTVGVSVIEAVALVTLAV
jgi:hypothetical protein